MPTILAVRTPTHKLITYPDFEKWTELFDLEADPDEMRNLVGYRNSISRHIEMCNLLQQMLAETDYIRQTLSGHMVNRFNEFLRHLPGACQAACDHLAVRRC